MGFSLRGNPFLIIWVTCRCLHTPEIWKKPWLLAQVSVLEAPCLWRCHHPLLHLNSLEMMAIFLALRYMLPDLKGFHVPGASADPALSADWHIRYSSGPRQTTLSEGSLHPWDLTQGADILSRQGLWPREVFALEETTHCPLWFSHMNPVPLGLDPWIGRDRGYTCTLFP